MIYSMSFEVQMARKDLKKTKQFQVIKRLLFEGNLFFEKKCKLNIWSKLHFSDSIDFANKTCKYILPNMYNFANISLDSGIRSLLFLVIFICL